MRGDLLGRMGKQQARCITARRSFPARRGARSEWPACSSSSRNGAAPDSNFRCLKEEWFACGRSLLQYVNCPPDTVVSALILKSRPEIRNRCTEVPGMNLVAAVIAKLTP